MVSTRRTTLRWPILVVDTETTGMLDDPRARVSELAGVVVDAEGRPTAGWSSLVNPWHPRRRVSLREEEREALSYSDLDVDLLLAAPGPKDVSASFLSFWITQGRPPVTSWRRAFDRDLMKRSLPVADVVTWGPCIWELARDALGAGPDRGRGLPGPHLEWAASELGVDVWGRLHRAMPDALTAARVLAALP